MLVGKYIPDLAAKTFEVSREYAQLIYDQTSSPRLDKVLKKWDQDNWASAEQRQRLAYIICKGDGVQHPGSYASTPLQYRSSRAYLG